MEIFKVHSDNAYTIFVFSNIKLANTICNIMKNMYVSTEGKGMEL